MGDKNHISLQKQMKKRGSKTAGDLSASKLPLGVVKSFSVKESDLYHTVGLAAGRKIQVLDAPRSFTSRESTRLNEEMRKRSKKRSKRQTEGWRSAAGG